MKTCDKPLIYEFEAIDPKLLQDYKRLQNIEVTDDLRYLLSKATDLDIDALCDKTYDEYQQFVVQRMLEMKENMFGKLWCMYHLVRSNDGKSVYPYDKYFIYMYDWRPETGYLFAIVAKQKKMPYAFSIEDTTFSADMCEDIFTERLRFTEVDIDEVCDSFSKYPYEVFQYRIKRELEKRNENKNQ